MPINKNMAACNLHSTFKWMASYVIQVSSLLSSEEQQLNAYVCGCIYCDRQQIYRQLLKGHIKRKRCKGQFLTKNNNETRQC